ncbi:MAG: cytochrome C [Desulfuromonas sp.]|mgnify:CR=1 FL=1|nr:MAG: cytochrome C [Desulfuromonas sp.]
MKKKLLIPAVLLCTATLALAVPPGKILEFSKSMMGKVTFSGEVHKNAGVKCGECHTKVFEYKKGTAKITMAKIYAGEQCGTCHNGGRAFAAKGNCKRCHKR